MRTALSSILVSAIISFCDVTGAKTDAFDVWHPGAGRISFSGATGVPFVGMAEAAVGLSDQVSIGALAGLTPRVAGVGLRPRVTFIKSDVFRLTLVVPTLYYPRTNAAEGAPWLLTRPVLAFEGRLGSSWWAFVGFGLYAASSIQTLERLITGSDAQQAQPYGGAQSDSIALWNTVMLGSSVRLGKHTAFFVDAGLVFDDFVLATEWVGGPPFTLSMGISVTL